LPRGLDPGANSGIEFLVDLLKKRRDNGIPVIGREFVMDLGGGTDLLRGKPRIVHGGRITVWVT